MPTGSPPLWVPGGVPGEWADVCGFLIPPGSRSEWQVRMHGAFTIPYATLGLKEKDQSCHPEVWVHLSHVNARADERTPRYNQSQRLHLKERDSTYDHGKERKWAHPLVLKVIRMTFASLSIMSKGFKDDKSLPPRCS